jgi:hypothetical protein
VTIIIVVLLLVGGGMAFVFRERLVKSPVLASQPPAGTPGKTNPSAPRTIYPVPTEFDWTLEMTKAVFPQMPASGRIHGAGFMCERATLQGGTLTLRQGRGSPPDLAVAIHLFAQQGEELGGKLIEIAPDRAPPLPKVVMRWKDQQEKGASLSFNQGYAMKLVFAEPVNGRIEGKIYLSLPDDSKTFVAGNFNAEIKKPAPPKQKTQKAQKVKSSG